MENKNDSKLEALSNKKQNLQREMVTATQLGDLPLVELRIDEIAAVTEEIRVVSAALKAEAAQAKKAEHERKTRKQAAQAQGSVIKIRRVSSLESPTTHAEQAGSKK